MRRRATSWLQGLFFVGALTSAVGCAVNPATGKRELALIDEGSEIEIGQKLDREIVEGIGVYEHRPLEEMVARVGTGLAAASEREHLEWHFRVLDDPTVNAFALPGGYVYVTRGLLAHLGDEAELAAVLGHEIGHVTSRHSVNQISRAILAERSLGVFRILDPMNQHVGAAMSQRFNMALLRHSREHEIESDDLAIRYMQRGGYDAAALVRVLDTLAQLEAHVDGPKVPTSQSTHPEPAFRRDRQRSRLAKSPPPTGTADIDGYLGVTDSLVYGDDPRRGYRTRDRYIDPTSGLGMEIPADWKAQMDPEFLAATSASGAGVVVLARTRYESAEESMVEFLGHPSIRGGPEWTGPAGLPAFTGRRFLLETRSGRLEGVVVFFEHGEAVRMAITLSGGENAAEMLEAGVRALSSLRIIRDSRAINVQPMRISIVTLEQPTSLSRWFSEHPESVPLDTLALINHVGPDETLPAGKKIKTVSAFRAPDFDW